MAEDIITTTGIARHGATRLPSVDVDSFNMNSRTTTASSATAPARGRFARFSTRCASRCAKSGEDPLGKKAAEDFGRASSTRRWRVTMSGRGAVHGAIEEFAGELAIVTGRFLKTKAWADTERIVVGGGFRQSRVGELAIARTDVILKAEGFKVDLAPIRFQSRRCA